MLDIHRVEFSYLNAYIENINLSHYIFTNYYLFIYLFLIFIVIQLQLSAFSPHPSTPPQPKPPPSPASTLPLDFVHVSFIGVRVNASPHYPLPTTRSPLAIVRLFLTSMSLVIFCLLISSVDYVPVKGEIIWYLSLTA